MIFLPFPLLFRGEASVLRPNPFGDKRCKKAYAAWSAARLLPKALVDSERILTRLRADGYAMSPDYEGADVVLVNTCGFLDSAKEESLAAIGEAIAENGRVIVTGCMGNEADLIRAKFSPVLASPARISTKPWWRRCTRPHRPAQRPFIDLVPQKAGQADPAPLQLSEDFRGLQPRLLLLHHPQLRGKLASRRIDAVLREAEKLVAAGTKRTAGDQPGHVGLWRRHPPRGARMERAAGARAHDRSGARTGQLRTPRAGRRGCGCTTSIPIRTSTR
jgi:ribosomal protein S12 methylthiotransferase